MPLFSAHTSYYSPILPPCDLTPVSVLVSPRSTSPPPPPLAKQGLPRRYPPRAAVEARSWGAVRQEQKKLLQAVLPGETWEVWYNRLLGVKLNKQGKRCLAPPLPNITPPPPPYPLPNTPP